MHHIARRLAREHGGDPVEFERDGLVGLVEAAQRYDPAKNDEFTKYASRRIRGAMIDGFRKQDLLSRTERQRRRGGAPLDRTQVGGTALARVTADDALPARHVRRFVEELLETLPERTREILVLHYVREQKLLDIAKLFGITESRVCQIAKQALVDMRAVARQNGVSFPDVWW